MKNISIAGGNGGIGKEIVKVLKSEGKTINIIAKDSLDVLECDVLILNSGIGWFGKMEEISVEKIKDLIWINLERHILLSKNVIKSWKDRRSGHFVFIASNSAYEGFSGNNVYSATKAGLLGYARSLAKECREFGIKVSIISPGTTDTDFWLNANGDNRSKCNPVHPKEIAEAVSFCINTPSIVSEMIVVPR